jgi:uracil phosphoribosyltransferase
MHFVLTQKNSLANEFLAELRDRELQQDRMRFRKNLERLGEIMAYEISKTLVYKNRQVNTPLGISSIEVIAEQPVLVTILRAGLAYFQGFINFFDKADCGFIGAYRQEEDKNLAIKLSYVATQSLYDKTVLMIDPMLATGRSVTDAIKAITLNGNPRHIHIVSLVASPEGIEFLKAHLTVPYSLWTCAVDEKLDENYYIVPGLGDAGDLSYGIKKL